MRIGNNDVDGADRKALDKAVTKLWVGMGKELERFLDTVGPSQPSAPIYHYTTAAGLQGIADECAIFLTDASYLSDKTELRYGRELISEILTERKDRASGALGAFYRERLATFDPFSGHFRATYYVASFCERSDLLSQWRTYGDESAGFALGFPAETFVSGGQIMTLAPEASALHRIEYVRETQKQIISHVLQCCEESFLRDIGQATNVHDERILDASYFGLFMLQLASLLPQFKHPMFHEEREWRLTLSRMREGDDELVDFRALGKDLLPFVRFPLKLPNGLLPLCEIVVSPANEPALQSRTVRKLLRRKQYPEGSVKVVEPEIPLEFR